MQEYKKFQRKGTWSPGDPEKTFRSPISSFTGELLNSEGELFAGRRDDHAQIIASPIHAPERGNFGPASVTIWT